MRSSGYSACEQTDVHLLLTVTATYIEGTSKVHSCDLEWVDSIHHALNKQWRVWCLVWSSCSFVAGDTCTKQLPDMLST